MKIPNKLKIGAHNYDVSFDFTLSRDRETPGQSCFNGLWIRIDDTVPETVREDALIHEIFEQICDQNNIRLEHQILTTIAAQFYQVLKDNKLKFD